MLCVSSTDTKAEQKLPKSLSTRHYLCGLNHELALTQGPHLLILLQWRVNFSVTSQRITIPPCDTTTRTSENTQKSGQASVFFVSLASRRQKQEDQSLPGLHRGRDPCVKYTHIQHTHIRTHHTIPHTHTHISTHHSIALSYFP